MALQQIGQDALKASNKLDQEVVKNSKIKPSKNILDEDTFAEDVEKIIQRDFFPDLEKLTAQGEYIDAQERNDTEKMRSLMVKYGPKRPRPGTDQQVYFTPSTFETPEIELKKSPSSMTDATRNNQQQEQDITHNPEKPLERDKDAERINKSLDQYLVKNTSEDNASFEEILESNAQAHRTKYGWLYEQEAEKGQILKDSLALPSIEQQAIESGSSNVKTWAYTPRNSLMYVPDGADLSSSEKVKLKLKPREIVRSNTRFHENPFNMELSKSNIAEAAANQAITKQGKIGVDGKEVLPDNSPKVGGYGFMGTPSPAPGVNESPLMTWGEIDGTPFRLDGSDTPVTQTPGPKFKMPKIPKRDQIAMELAEKASKAHRAKKQAVLKKVTANLPSPSPKFGSVSSMDRIKNMSAAAQRLASGQLGIRTLTDKALRESYTPSPSHSLPGDKTPVSLTPTSTRSNRTPRSIASSRTTPKHTGDVSSLTDNLLKLPSKRARATDFF